MELKVYQQAVVADVLQYLSILKRSTTAASAYREFWNRKGVVPGTGTLPDYRDAVAGVPHVCLKVPTAGGKTFIACNALRPVFEALPSADGNLVIWLVPSLAILEQTLKNLRDSDHPYRKRLNAEFAGRIEVFSKEEALSGAGFSPTSLEAQLNIVVMGFDSFRATNKEGRKVYQENSQLVPFAEVYGMKSLSDSDETSLVRVFARMNPVVVVDESHNAQTSLSLEMLRNLNPRFILELTATPRETSNIISTVHSSALKAENMVKLPVIVYNDHDASQVLYNAVSLRAHLEQMAEEQERGGGPYIRPIVLVQAEPKHSTDAETFEKLKKKLIESGIPESHVVIKTAQKDELSRVDLLSKDCPVRYIITVNALKEGWDCPFAYILATVSNRSSKVEVEQVLGRILRQPYARRLPVDLLNLSYVFTCSQQFHLTLDEIVKGLNRAGFSRDDYRVAGNEIPEASASPSQFELSPEPVEEKAETPDQQSDPIESLDTQEIREAAGLVPEGHSSVSYDGEGSALREVIQNAREEERRLRSVADRPFGTALPLSGKGTAADEAWKNGFPMRVQYRERAEEVVIPQFFKRIPGSLFTDPGTSETLLSRVHLLEGFRLSGKDTEINFSTVSGRAYAVDIDTDRGMETPEYVMLKTDDPFYRKFVDFLKRLPIDDLKREVASQIKRIHTRLNYLLDADLAKYVERVLENLSNDQLEDLKERPGEYITRIMQKIDSLISDAAEQSFRKLLPTDAVFLKPSWRFPDRIAPGRTHSGIPKALYEEEGELNGFEHKVINEVANLDNILFWHRNIERREFYINAFLNHYPDFIVVTKNGKVFLVETKGDDRDNSDSLQKMRLGKTWADRAGDRFGYFMVFDTNPIQDAWAYSEFIDLMRKL